MPAHILLVSGFLGAGKTTLINRLLQDPRGRRIAAVVNDFGTVNIDAALLSSATDDVMSLKNGCICCTLQGDLMRTLSALIKRTPSPEVIVIETSGISNPKDIVSRLLDPVIFKAAALDTVVTVVDAAYLADSPAMAEDPLWQSQVEAADILVINKGELLDAGALAGVKHLVKERHPTKHRFDAQENLPSLLLGHMSYAPTSEAGSSAPRPSLAPEFETATWTSTEPLSLPAFQAWLNRFSTDLIRMKGFVEFIETPGRSMLFQMVGTRATISPSPIEAPGDARAVLVLIGRSNLDGVSKAMAALDLLANKAA